MPHLLPPRALLRVCPLLLFLCACTGAQGSLPPELIGRWVTEDQRYAERYFEVTDQGALIFGQGAGQTRSGMVESVVLSPTDTGGEHCEIEYVDEEGLDSRMAVELSPRGESLIFENSRKVRWKREETPR